MPTGEIVKKTLEQEPISLQGELAKLFLGNQGLWIKNNPFARYKLANITPADIISWISRKPKVEEKLAAEAQLILDSFENPNAPIEPQYQLHPQLAQLARIADKETKLHTGHIISGFDVIAGGPLLRVFQDWLVQDVVIVEKYQRKPQAVQVGGWKLSPPIPFIENVWPDGYQNQIVKVWKDFTAAVGPLLRPIMITAGIRDRSTYKLLPPDRNNPQESKFSHSLGDWNSLLGPLSTGSQLIHFTNPFTALFKKYGQDPRLRDQGIRVMVSEPDRDSVYEAQSATSWSLSQFMNLTGEKVLDAITKVFEKRMAAIYPLINSSYTAAEMFNAYGKEHYRDELRKSSNADDLTGRFTAFNQALYALWPRQFKLMGDDLLYGNQNTSALTGSVSLR